MHLCLLAWERLFILRGYTSDDAVPKETPLALRHSGIYNAPVLAKLESLAGACFIFPTKNRLQQSPDAGDTALTVFLCAFFGCFVNVNFLYYRKRGKLPVALKITLDSL